MKLIVNFAFGYMVAGLLAGLFYRSLTKTENFTGYTQLAVVHTHLLTLGMMFLLVVLVLEKLFTLTASRQFRWFFWLFNAGLIITAAMLGLHGTLTVFGDEVSPAISGIAGLGHITLTAGFVLFFLTLRSRVVLREPRVPTAEISG